MTPALKVVAGLFVAGAGPAAELAPVSIIAAVANATNTAK